LTRDLAFDLQPAPSVEPGGTQAKRIKANSNRDKTGGAPDCGNQQIVTNERQMGTNTYWGSGLVLI